ncbi:MAG: DUF2721 domain-containing protein [Gemmatimonadaceae bacterium]|nr:DUF2721 domain-containing protein [Gemmatimonadaceae bacterium]
MMQSDAPTAAIAHVIQLAVAPVFLLTGIASLLVVLTNRLGRIIDRARTLEGVVPDLTGEHHALISADLHMLSRRARYVNRGISLFTLSALLVCVLISVLFLGAFYTPDVSRLVAGLFVGAMIGLIVGLLAFLREVQLATASLRIGPH